MFLIFPIFYNTCYRYDVCIGRISSCRFSECYLSSKRFSKVSISIIKLYSITSIVFGFLLIALYSKRLSNLILSSPSLFSAPHPLLGDIIIVAAQVVVSVQMVVEEKFIGKYKVPPLQVNYLYYPSFLLSHPIHSSPGYTHSVLLTIISFCLSFFMQQVVGWEGFFGLTILSSLLIPFYYIPGDAAGTYCITYLYTHTYILSNETNQTNINIFFHIEILLIICFFGYNNNRRTS